MTEVTGPAGGRLDSVRIGSAGRPFVFLHPLPTDKTYWLYQLAHFSTWYRTMAIDLPGCGGSPSAPEGSGLADFARACWAEVDEAFDREPVIIAGVSVGSTVAQFMASQRPERVGALILTAGGYFPASDARYRGNLARAVQEIAEQGLIMRRQRVVTVQGERFAATALGAYFADLWGERPLDAGALLLYRALQVPVPEGMHATIKAPTLIVSGTADPGHEAHKILAGRIPGAELRIMDGAGHTVSLERPWEYDGLVIEFLTRLGLHDSAAPLG